jgi:hypothetical protein
MTGDNERHPRLRAVEVRSVVHQGRPALLLRDPLELSGQALVVPQHLGPLLALCDGTRDAAGLAAALQVRYGMSVTVDHVRGLLAALDEALMLDNERSASAILLHTEEFRALPYREATGAGRSYPADRMALEAALVSLGLDPASGEGEQAAARGVVSPHIDFARGGRVYASVWNRVRQALSESDIVVVLGTDHQGSPGSVTLTRQRYGSPLGVLPTAVGVVDEMVDQVGADPLFAEELHHRLEHSIELAAIWLQAAAAGEEIEMLPVLLGPPQIGTGAPAGDLLERVLEVLVEATAGRSAFVVAAADLAHVGPAFGGRPVGTQGQEALRAADRVLLDHLCAGDADRFLRAIVDVENRHNVCGVTPIYAALRLLGETRGEATAYELCPADDDGTSVVSICGAVLA